MIFVNVAPPEWVKQALSEDEVPVWDLESGYWYGILHGDESDDRNIRKLEWD